MGRVGMTQFEKAAAGNGFRHVAGVDEVGRGPLAGPLVAAAVVLRQRILGLNDSKLLTPEERESLFAKIMSGRNDVGVGMIEVEELDSIGLQNANYAAMRRAAEALSSPPDFLLVDGFAIRGCAIPQQHIVKGDRKSVSIAAASIVAKVTRDRIMVNLDAQFPEYGFARHKGYATAEHLSSLERFGPCAIHRKSFAPIARAQGTASLFAVDDFSGDGAFLLDELGGLDGLGGQSGLDGRGLQGVGQAHV